MENFFVNVLIVDDEKIVREGLKHLIDWNSLGFYICGEASNGTEAIERIRNDNPDLILLDIRMPKMYGTDLIEQMRGEGFEGSFIIISGFSDFKYAQAAMKYGAADYLTKPVDEDQLTKAILSVKSKLEQRHSDEYLQKEYLKKAKITILADLLKQSELATTVDYAQMGLLSPVYQVVMYEGYTPFYHPYSFSDILRISDKDCDLFEHITLDNKDVILLKGNAALDKLRSVTFHYKAGTEKGSPLDTIFLTYGPLISNLSQIHSSYEICKKLMSRRFFCEENQHILSYEELPYSYEETANIEPETSDNYSNMFLDYIQTFNRRLINEELSLIKKDLFTCSLDTIGVKHFLIDIFLQIKQSILHRYPGVEIPFSANSQIIELIENKYYLYEILGYFSEQFEIIMHAIGNNSSDSVFDDIIYYISHNYQMNLKLESIAPLFGYNSSYLGKLFTQKLGCNFNSYLDDVRIKEASKLLTDTDFKVYEIANKVGYNNVDYFHQKFRKKTGMSPAEFRKKAID